MKMAKDALIKLTVNDEESKIELKETKTLSIEQIRDDVARASCYYTINEKFFAQKEALTFA